MKNYIGTKTLIAVAMTLSAYNEKRGWTIPENEDPNREGYFVEYPDGYQSWSPKEVFEASYKEINAVKELVAGHTYELPNFENRDGKGQILQFIHKEPESEGSTVLKTVSDGTTNEDVITAVIKRLQFLNSKFPCKENAVAITHLEEAVLWLEKRTLDRIKRSVEGKNIS